MSIGSLVSSGPLLLAVPVAAAAGAVTFLSPCCLPLVPGYLSYVTGMSGMGAQLDDPQQASAPLASAQPVGARSASVPSVGAGPGRVGAPLTGVLAVPPRSRVVVGTALFVLGFSALYTSYGLAFGGLGTALKSHQQVLTQVLGCLLYTSPSPRDRG